MAKVHFIDVTNRDGVQAPRMNLSKFQKTMLNWYLGRLGIHQSEMGFPMVEHEQNYIKANLQLQGMGALGKMVLSGWCRAVAADVRASLPTGLKDFNLSISTSDQMIRNKFQGKLDRASVIKEMVEAVRVAREGGARTIGANAEDASRTDMEYLVEFALAAKEAGAQRLRYCDTVGYESPHSIEARVYELATRTQMTIELHCHDDLGMAVANSIAGARGALEAGQDTWINTSANGIGERAGGADLLSCILAFKYGRGLDQYEMGDPIDLTVAWPLTNYVADVLGIPIPVNQPGVGANMFTHESGIHADGALKDRQNYELYDYPVLGIPDQTCAVTGRSITTGEYGGMGGFKHVYQRLGITFDDDEQAHYILNLVQFVNAHNHMPFIDDELRFIARYPEQVRQLLTVNPPPSKGSPALKAIGNRISRE
ncbi:MAG: hypothetical protein HY676_02380 [Chloroflexi bacterium]|nr:hypothetical protein [Chloroflexota bacterium]